MFVHVCPSNKYHEEVVVTYNVKSATAAVGAAEGKLAPFLFEVRLPY